MNKKLKIYSTLFIVTFIILAVTSTFHYNNYTWTGTPEDKLEFADCPPEFMSRDTLPSGTVITNRHLTMSYEVNVMPKDTPERKVLLSKTKDQTYQVNMKKVDLGVPILEFHTQGAVVPGVRQAAVDFGARKDKSAVLTQRYQLVHRQFSHCLSLRLLSF